MRAWRAALVVASLLSFVATATTGPAAPASAAAGTGAFTPLRPTRIHDTRTSGGRIGAAATRSFQVTTKGGVPASGVSAVVVNITVASPSGSGYLTVWPKGQARPTVSSLNFVAGQTVANLVTVPLGTGGQIDVFNAVGATHVLIDVEGYYASTAATAGTPTGFFKPVAPQRLRDTRNDGFGKIPPDTDLRVWVDYGAQVNPHVKALAVNITAVSPTGPGYLTVWDNTYGQEPNTSMLNYVAGRNVANMAIVPVAPCAICPHSLPTIGIQVTGQGSTHVLVDIVGYFDDGTQPGTLAFRPLVPKRIVDSRSDIGTTTLGPAATREVVVGGTIGTPNTKAIVTNATAVRPSATTYLTLWPKGSSQPTTSNVNANAGTVVPNHTITVLGTDRTFRLFNGAGTTNVLVDVVGTFEPRA